MLAIYKKELRSYFTSMVGYVFMALFLVIIGIFFYLNNLYSRVANFEYTVSNASFIFVLLVPILTMRLMAEENRQKTDQLLLTSPLTAESIIFGKYLAVFTVFLIDIAIICTWPIILRQYGNVPFAGAYASIFGFALLGGAYLAIGLFLSSLTESQVVAAVITFIVFFFTLFMDNIANMIPSDHRSSFLAFAVLILLICFILYLVMHNLTVAVSIGLIGETALAAVYLKKPELFDGLLVKVFGWLSVVVRFGNFYIGILNLEDVIYYLSLIFIFLFLATQVIKKKRWS